MSNFPIQFTDKVNSPELLAFMQQFGEHTYVDAELINKFRDALNELHVSLNPDRIISLGTETILGNQRTYEGYKWQINGVEVNNIGNPIQLNFPSATVGFKRNDISVFKPDGTIERIAGIETDGEIVSPPDVPEGTLYFKTYSIDGNVVESEPEPPTIDGSIYKKKIENTRYKSRLSGENIIIPFQAAGQSHYSVTHAALVSVAGFTTAGLTTPMYEGQDVIFENQTGHDITLKDSFGVETSFVIGADLIVPNNGKIWFRFRNNELELIMKSWSEVDLSAKQDKIQQITHVTLLTSGWSLVSGLYQYNYSNVNITTTTIVDVIPDNSTIEIVKNAEILPQTNSSNGSVTIFSKNLPTLNIVVTLNIFN